MLSWSSRAIARVLSFALLILLLTPSPTLAEHQAPLPATHEELVCGFVSNLDRLLNEFDQGGVFGDDRLNRALEKARASVASARAEALVPDLTGSFRHLRAAMRELEKGAAVPVSGNGFADDLASLGSFFAEIFTEDLIALSDLLGAVSAGALEDATLDFEDGVESRDFELWERGVTDFGQAVRTLERELDIGPPCPS